MQLPQRKSPRMRCFDYSMPTAYFVTICTADKTCIFGSPSQLNARGQIAADAAQRLPQQFSGLAVEHFVIMPNHVHLLLTTAPSHTLTAVVGAYKSRVTRLIHATGYKGDIWQRSFHDHVVRTQDAWERIWKYIEENPYMWETDCFYHG